VIGNIRLTGPGIFLLLLDQPTTFQVGQQAQNVYERMSSEAGEVIGGPLSIQ
jgi:hypothetical protein